jgi:hypothetical protein
MIDFDDFDYCVESPLSDPPGESESKVGELLRASSRLRRCFFEALLRLHPALDQRAFRPEVDEIAVHHRCEEERLE